MEIRERSSEKVEQLAASIADMINEINQSEEAR
jgi:chromosome partitioning protein